MMARIRTRTINARRRERLLWKNRLFTSFWEFISASDGSACKDKRNGIYGLSKVIVSCMLHNCMESCFCLIIDCYIILDPSIQLIIDVHG